MATFTALQQHTADRPISGARAARTVKALRPTQPKQLVTARLLGGKLTVKLPQAARKFLHRQPYYRLGQPESSKYPP